MSSHFELLKRLDTKLQVKFSMNVKPKQWVKFTSPRYLMRSVRGYGFFQLQVSSTTMPFYKEKAILVRFSMLDHGEDSSSSSILVKLRCPELDLFNKRFTSDTRWQLLDIIRSKTYKKEFSFNVIVEMDVITKEPCFALFFKDMDLTGFQLRGEDGSVRVYKEKRLAAASPFMRNKSE